MINQRSHFLLGGLKISKSDFIPAGMFFCYLKDGTVKIGQWSSDLGDLLSTIDHLVLAPQDYEAIVKAIG